MKKLLIYLKDNKKECVLGPLFKLLEASLELLVPLVVAALIDKGIGGAGKADAGFIVKMALLLVAFGAVGLAFSLTAQFFAAKAATGFAARVRSALFRHIGRLSYTRLDGVGTSTLITRMTSDMNQVQTGLNLTLRLLLRSPFVVFGAAIMAFTVDVRAALVFAVAIPLLSVVVFGIMLLCIPLYKSVQAKLDRVVSRTRENLIGVRVIRAFCKEKEETERFKEETGELALSQRVVGRISALLNPLTYVMINLAIIALIHTGALRVEAGLLTQGAVVALYNYMSQILGELIKLADLIINITKSIACAKRISAVFDIPAGQEQAEDTPDGGAAAVEFKNVSFKYGAGENVLSDISFTAQRGQTVGIIGGTGSGKTSLINLIPRFYDASDGCVFVDSRDVRSYNPDALRAKIGIVPQKAVLFKGTVAENLRWGDSSAGDDALKAALKAAQAYEIIESRPEGLNAPVEQGGKNFSGGQRQRLTIARALVRRPEILILDDSASALDFATDAALRKAISELDWQPCVFIVSQRTASIMHADIILVLDDGRLVGKGTHPQLLEGCETYREIYDSQFKKEARQ